MLFRVRMTDPGGREKTTVCNRNKLDELQDAGYVLEEVLEKVTNATDLGRKDCASGHDREAFIGDGI